MKYLVPKFAFSGKGGIICRVATVREKYLENEFFPGQGEVREFCGWSGKV